MEEARQLIARLAATPDAAVPRLPFLHRALTLPLLSTASVALRMSRILSSSRLRRRRALPVPVVSVGNITWGGNGKTPMVEYLARAFHRLGVSPLLLTRASLVPAFLPLRIHFFPSLWMSAKISPLLCCRVMQAATSPGCSGGGFPTLGQRLGSVPTGQPWRFPCSRNTAASTTLTPSAHTATWNLVKLGSPY
jgi:hypothetical protein